MIEPSRAETDLTALRQTIKALHSQLDAAGGRFLFGSKNQSYSEVKRSLDALKKLADRAASRPEAEQAELREQIVRAQQTLADACRTYLAGQEAEAGGKSAARAQAVRAVLTAAEAWLRPAPPAAQETETEKEKEVEAEAEPVPAADPQPEQPERSEQPEQPEEAPEEQSAPEADGEPSPAAPPDEPEPDPVSLSAQERSRLRLGQFAFRRSAGRGQDGAEAALAVVAWSRLEQVLDRTREAVLSPETAAAARSAMSGVAKQDAALLPLLPGAGAEVTFGQVKEFLLQASDHALEAEDNLTKPLPKKRRARKTARKAQ